MTTVHHSYVGGRPLLPVAIGVNQPMIFALANAGRRVPKPIDCIFLVDTGAEDTYVNRLALNRLGLNPTNAIQIQTGIPGSQPFLFDQYEIKLRVPATVLGQTDFVLDSMSVLCGDFSAQRIDGLIGRDLLAHCVTQFDGPRQVFSLHF